MPTDGNPFSLDDGVWLKAALHTHTKRSDGDLDPRPRPHHEWMGLRATPMRTLIREVHRALLVIWAELAADR
jgi:hypothetical protein